MLAIIRHIEYLLRRNDCVVLPGFGAFIVHKENADLTESGVLIPPVKQLAFNGAITHNDGMLATSLMRKQSISYDCAVSIISNEVSALKAQLSEFGEIDFGKLGRFYESESVITFEPAPMNNFFGDYFGLATLNLAKPEPEAVGEKIVEEKPRRKDVIYIPINKGVFRMVATVAVLIALTFVLSTPIIVDQKSDTADLVPTVTISKPKVKVPVAKVVEPKTVEAEVAEVKTANDADKFYLIVASFKTEKAAHKFVEESKMAGLRIMDKAGNYYKIYSASSNSFQEMENERQRLQASNIDAWVFSAD